MSKIPSAQSSSDNEGLSASVMDRILNLEKFALEQVKKEKKQKGEMKQIASRIRNLKDGDTTKIAILGRQVELIKDRLDVLEKTMKSSQPDALKL